MYLPPFGVSSGGSPDVGRRLRQLLAELDVALVPPSAHRARRHRLAHRAPRFDRVRAIGKAALIEQRTEFRKALRNLARIDAPEPHFAQPRRVSDESATRQRMQQRT